MAAMVSSLQRSSSWPGRLLVLTVAVLAMSWGHSGGVETRAFAENVGAGVLGSVLGLGMLAIVVARLFGRNVGLITSDRQAIGALLVMIAVKIAIARMLLAF